MDKLEEEFRYAHGMGCDDPLCYDSDLFMAFKKGWEASIAALASSATPQGNWPTDFQQIVKNAEDAAYRLGHAAALAKQVPAQEQANSPDEILGRLIAYVGDNWPMKKHTLEEIELGLEAYRANLLKRDVKNG